MQCWRRQLRPSAIGVPLLFIRRSFFAGAVRASIQLRPYQEGCIDACTEALNSGITRIGVSLPTGSGKTTIFLYLLSQLKPPSTNPFATRSLVIVNSIELARQTAAQAVKLRPDWYVEIEQGAKHKASGNADVTIATYQTLHRSNRLDKFDPSSLKAIIVDEAHHAVAPSYRHILSRFDPAIKGPDSAELDSASGNPDSTISPSSGNLDSRVTPSVPSHNIPIIGFSATFSRHDGLALGSVFDRIVYHISFVDMMKDQWLSNVRFTTVQANLRLENVEVSEATGDFIPTSLARAVDTHLVNNLILKTWLDRAANRRSTLVFCVNLSHVRNLTQAFRDAGIDARYIYSATPAAERKALIAAFKEAQFPVLVNCAILTEGADIPSIDCVIVAKPTRSRNVLAQMIGRGMRLSPQTGKQDCRVIDFVDSATRVAGIVSTPTLFGLPPMELDDETLESLEARALEQAQREAKDNDLSTPGRSRFHISGDLSMSKAIKYTDYDDPFSFVGDNSGDPHISKISQNAWVSCGGNIYVLECINKGYIRIEPVEDPDESGIRWRAHYNRTVLDKELANAMKMPMISRNKKILDAHGLVEAVRGCDTYAKTEILPGHGAAALLSSARWRNGPASEKQKNFVRKKWRAGHEQLIIGDRAQVERTKERQEKIAQLTRGQAANIITRLRHGAQSRYMKEVKAARRAEEVAAKAAKKEQARRAREHVQEGPLPV